MPQAKAKATQSERKKINALRDKILKDLLDSGIVGNTKLSKSDREKKNKARDQKLKSIRYQTGKKAGRPKKAITLYREGAMDF